MYAAPGDDFAEFVKEGFMIEKTRKETEQEVLCCRRGRDRTERRGGSMIRLAM